MTTVIEVSYLEKPSYVHQFKVTTYDSIQAQPNPNPNAQGIPPLGLQSSRQYQIPRSF